MTAQTYRVAGREWRITRGTARELAATQFDGIRPSDRVCVVDEWINGEWSAHGMFTRKRDALAAIGWTTTGPRAGG